MNYEEKRELRLQISQLLADAGLNQGVIKQIVEKEITDKVKRAVDQQLEHLNAQCSSGDFIKEHVNKIFGSASMNYHISQMIKEELKDRVIKVELKDVSYQKEDT